MFCKRRGNPYVEIEHWLAHLLQLPDSDWHRVIKQAQLELSAPAKGPDDRLPRGATSISGVAESIADAIERGWVYGTRRYGDSVERSGYLLAGMRKTKNVRNALGALSREFEKLEVDDISDAPTRIIAGSREDRQGVSDGSGAAGGAAPGEASGAIAGRRWASRRR